MGINPFNNTTITSTTEKKISHGKRGLLSLYLLAVSKNRITTLWALELRNLQKFTYSATITTTVWSSSVYGMIWLHHHDYHQSPSQTTRRNGERWKSESIKKKIRRKGKRENVKWSCWCNPATLSFPHFFWLLLSLSQIATTFDLNK